MPLLSSKGWAMVLSLSLWSRKASPRSLRAKEPWFVSVFPNFPGAFSLLPSAPPTWMPPCPQSLTPYLSTQTPGTSSTRHFQTEAMKAEPLHTCLNHHCWAQKDTWWGDTQKSTEQWVELKWCSNRGNVFNHLLLATIFVVGLLYEQE